MMHAYANRFYCKHKIDSGVASHSQLSLVLNYVVKFYRPINSRPHSKKADATRTERRDVAGSVQSVMFEWNKSDGQPL